MSKDRDLEATISDLNGTRLQEVNGCGLHGGRKFLAPGGSQKAEQLSLGLRAEISVRVMPQKRRLEKELKLAGDKNKNAIWALLLSLLALITTFQKNYHNYQLVPTPNEMAGRFQPINDRPPCLSCLSQVLRSFQRRQFIWCQDLPSTSDKQNPLRVNRMQKTYCARTVAG